MIVTSYVRFKQNIPGSTLDLKLGMKLQVSGENFIEGQGTPNVLADRKPRGRPKKIPTLNTSMLSASISEASIQYSIPLSDHQSTVTEDEPMIESTTEGKLPPNPSEMLTQQGAGSAEGTRMTDDISTTAAVQSHTIPVLIFRMLVA